MECDRPIVGPRRRPLVNSSAPGPVAAVKKKPKKKCPKWHENKKATEKPESSSSYLLFFFLLVSFSAITQPSAKAETISSHASWLRLDFDSTGFYLVVPHFLEEDFN